MRRFAKLLRGKSSRCLVLTVAVALVGAAAAQAVIMDTATGLPVKGVSYVTEYDGLLYFRATTETHPNPELWRTNGTTAEFVASVPGYPQGMGVYNNRLYIGATGSGVSNPSRLWQYDTTDGAMQAPGASANAQLPEAMTAYNGILYYRASRFGAPGNIGTELWKFDGATQTPIDMYPGTGSSYPQHFIQYNGQLYFNACGAAGQGSELWKTNGIGAPTLAANIYPNNGSSPENFAVHNGELFFSAYNGSGAGQNGRELWRYNGATASLAADIIAGSGSSNPNSLASYNGKLYFSADDGVNGFELWSYDGTTAAKVAEINPTPIPPPGDPNYGDTWLADSSPGNLTVFDGKLYFSANDGVHGRELWQYDSTTGVASLVADINPGPYGSEVGELTVYNGELYFAADGGYMRLHEGSAQPAMMSLSEVPEPGSLALLLCGAAALLLWCKRRR